MPVRYITQRSNPRPNPEWRVVGAEQPVDGAAQSVDAVSGISNPTERG